MAIQQIKTFELYGRTCRLSINDIFGDGVTQSLRLGYLVGGNWTYIYGETINENEANKDANAELERCLDILNKKANEMWATDTPEPQEGVARIIWLVENEVYVENNELKLK